MQDVFYTNQNQFCAPYSKYLVNSGADFFVQFLLVKRIYYNFQLNTCDKYRDRCIFGHNFLHFRKILLRPFKTR